VNTDSEIKHRENQDKFEKARLDLGRRAQDLRQRAADKAKKEARTAAPGKEIQSQALDQIMTDYPNLPAHEANVASFTVASRAMEIVNAQRGVGMAQALKQAWGEVDKAHDFKTVEKGYEIFGVEIPGTRGMAKPVTKYDPEGKQGAGDSSARPQAKSGALPGGLKILKGKPNDKWANVSKQAEALKYLQDNPNTADVFKSKYGFLPEGNWAEEDMEE